MWLKVYFALTTLQARAQYTFYHLCTRKNYLADLPTLYILFQLL